MLTKSPLAHVYFLGLAVAVAVAAFVAGCGDSTEAENTGAAEQPVAGEVCMSFERGLTPNVLDTYVHAGQPNTSFGANPELTIGPSTKALVQFDISSLPPGAAISRATLKMRTYQGNGGDVAVHQISKGWVEAVTYAQFHSLPLPAFSPAVEATFPILPLAFKSVDVKTAVTGWHASPATNHGFLLEASTFSAMYSSEAAGSRPHLRICFFPDVDLDGFAADVDCDDHDSTVHPGATELCDGKDDDCDGLVDEGLLGTVQHCGACNDACASGVCAGGLCATPTCSDGVKNGNETGVDCGGGCGGLCPGCFVEICDGIDNDCDGIADNGSPGSGLVCDSGGCGPGTTVCTNGAIGCVASQPYTGCTPPPVVNILSPSNGAVASADTIEVTGTVSTPATVTVGGVSAALSGLSFSALVALHEGSNLIPVAATDGLGSTGVASVLVLHDTLPPRLAILAPARNARINGTTTTVVGTVQDLLIGTVDAGDCTVTVNGVVAEVANRGFRALHVPVAKGVGTITVIATDSGGNTASAVVRVIGDPDPKARILVSSGDGQSAPVATALPQPLTALVVNNAGAPVPGVPVTFSVTRGNGSFSGATRSQTVVSSAEGLASVTLTLGTRAGQATDLVEASAPGFLGLATFAESAVASPAGVRVLQAIGGTNQRVVIASLAQTPLVALLSDSFGNAVENHDVTFEVIKGGGRVNGAASATVTTDADGRVYALLTCGGAEGVNSQLVRASYPGSSPVHFVASDVQQGPPAATAVSGVVRTNENAPIKDVLVKVKGTALQTQTDGEGRFSLVGAPVGPIHLEVDGTVAGPYPPLTFDLDLLAGVDNSMDRPIYLPLVDSGGVGVANPTTDLVLRRADTPGLVFTVLAGSTTFTGPAKACVVSQDNPYPCGLGCPCVDGVCSPKCGTVQVIGVHRDKIPMPPPDGSLPGIALAIMPHDAHFDPPAAIRFPNVDGGAPGEIVTIYSYDHDLAAFVGVGTAQVSEDGREVRSGPGQGIVRGGWHLVPTSRPPATDMGLGCELHKCDCDGNCTPYLGPVVANVSCTTNPPNQLPFPNPWLPPNDLTPDADCYTCPEDLVTCVMQPTTGNSCERIDACPPTATGPSHCMIPTVDNLDGLAVCCPDAQTCTNDSNCPMQGTVCCATPCQLVGGVTCCL